MTSSVKSLASNKRRSTLSRKEEDHKGVGWTFLTNHAHVLLCLYQQPDRRLRDVATAVGITERMVQRVVAELAEAGYLKITKEGRCNRYEINTALYLRHPLELQHTIGELMKVLSSSTSRRKS
jgi:DNA-binding MarR family transcriptional regulator